MRRISLLAALIVTAGQVWMTPACMTAAWAATDAPPAHRHAQPYAAEAARLIKALSDQQIGDLRAGRGMSLALAAELNRYPGPAHVIELADRLELSARQRTETEALWHHMTAEARAAGAEIIAREAALDGKFAAGAIGEADLAAATEEIGRLTGRLRFIHLKYHLAVKDLLGPEQVARYVELRGYGQSPAMAPAAPPAAPLQAPPAHRH